MRPPCSGHRIDFTEITRPSDEGYVEAQTVCRGCPFRVGCAKFSLHHDVAGLAAGMLPNQRRSAREAAGITPQRTQLLELLRVEQFTPELMEEQINFEDPELPWFIVQVINFWTGAGETASQIALRLPRVDVNGYSLSLGYGPARFTARTVSWVRSPVRTV